MRYPNSIERLIMMCVEMLLDGVNSDTGRLTVEPAEKDALLAILDPLLRSVRADISMISYLTSEHHHIVVSRGLELSPEASRRADLSYSICQHCVAMDFPLVVDDALSHPLLQGNLTVEHFGVAAYLGSPIHFPGRGAVGTVCVFQRRPRRWQTDDIERVIQAGEAIDARLLKWSASA
ncbi:GAF domain-containing protein [Tropicimonas sp. TH_r6]|uniref:GAF domain-containing protein n=1 Tax=Tropicimonas sp. TH_r6 TaxID=3082085 RepID=UPI002955B64E|nr:GAF domain-containing protein [Tropicimonas sp. TH_r6]MDV7143920.1 GAF domain-containing protein [Tropicimonas sp. TH_r6]